MTYEDSRIIKLYDLLRIDVKLLEETIGEIPLWATSHRFCYGGNYNGNIYFA